MKSQTKYHIPSHLTEYRQLQGDRHTLGESIYIKLPAPAIISDALPKLYRPQQNFTEAQSLVKKETTRFLIHSVDEIRIILFDEVVYCVAESNYTKIHLADGSKVMASKTLKDFETILYHPHFLRIHASYLINLYFIKRILKTQQCMVELSNNVLLDVSRARRDDLLQRITML